MQRKLNKIHGLLLPGVLGVSGLAGWAAKSQASMLTEFFNASIPSTTTDWNGNLSFPQFNPALGNLTSVEVTLTSAMSTNLTVTNSGASSSTGKTQTELEISITDAAGAFDPGDPFVPGSGYSTPEFDYLSSPKFSYSLAAGGNISSGPVAGNATYDSGVLTVAGVLAEFTGGGTIKLPAGTFTLTDLSNTGGNTNSTQVTTASLSGTVTYSYYVPEPGTVSLFSIGGVAALLHRRRRSEQA